MMGGLVVVRFDSEGNAARLAPFEEAAASRGWSLRSAGRAQAFDVARTVGRARVAFIDADSGATGEAVRCLIDSVAADPQAEAWVLDRPEESSLARRAFDSAASFAGERGIFTSGAWAIPLSALQGLEATTDAEVGRPLASRFARVASTPCAAFGPDLRPTRFWLKESAAFAKRHASHDGHHVLRQLEAGGINYSRLIADTVAPHLGQHVLEVGAGIGTLTEELSKRSPRHVALEADPVFAGVLRARFRNTPNVEVLFSRVEDTDWAALGQRGFDSVVLTNVLEHIEDDVAALKNFAAVLPVGGALILWVPALPGVFGSLDEAVGHHRRYTPDSLRRVVEAAGFSVEHITWKNVVGIAGWWLNSRVLRRRSIAPFQLRLFDIVVPHLINLESKLTPPVGLSLFCVARRLA